MHLVLNGINGHYLRNITLNAAADTEEVLAAVAYATDSRLLLDWCWDNKIPLKFWGRLDDRVAVTTPILLSFLQRQSPLFVCKLVQHHHAKVIWWRGVGVYIGSANFTDSAWNKNIEAGCFFEESEISTEMAVDLESMFSRLDTEATPLTEELYNEMVKRAKELSAKTPSPDSFWKSPSFKKWPGLIHTAPKTAIENNKIAFLEEWHSTLQDLRNIGALVSRDENRPLWVSPGTPPGAQADQFLHAHYYQRTFDGRKANYQEFYEKNKARQQQALEESILWWRNLKSAPRNEDVMLNESVPRLQKLLSKDKLLTLTYEEFEEICTRIHAIADYARRVRNKSVSLPDNGTRYSIAQKTTALAQRIWNDRAGNSSKIPDVLMYVLYGGSTEQTPERIWSAVSDPKWKIEGLGISAFGEIVGWALPGIFPPRNGRTSKALKSLGYNVTIHVE